MQVSLQRLVKDGLKAATPALQTPERVSLLRYCLFFSDPVPEKTPFWDL